MGPGRPSPVVRILTKELRRAPYPVFMTRLALTLSVLTLASFEVAPATAEAQLGSLIRGASRAARSGSGAARGAARVGRTGSHAAGSLGRGGRGLRGLGHLGGGRGLAAVTAAAALHAEPRAFALFRAMPDDLPRATYLTADGMGGYRAIASEGSNASRFGTSAGDALQGVHDHGTAIVLDLPAATSPDVLADLHGPLYVLDAAGQAHPVRRTVTEAGETRYLVDVQTNAAPGPLDDAARAPADLGDGVASGAEAVGEAADDELADAVETALDLAESAAEAAGGADPNQAQETDEQRRQREAREQDLEAFALAQIENLPPLALPALDPSAYDLPAPEPSSSFPTFLAILGVIALVGFKLWLFLRKKA